MHCTLRGDAKYKEDIVSTGYTGAAQKRKYKACFCAEDQRDRSVGYCMHCCRRIIDRRETETKAVGASADDQND